MSGWVASVCKLCVRTCVCVCVCTSPDCLRRLFGSCARTGACVSDRPVPPVPRKMMPCSDLVLNDRLISVATAKDRPESSIKPGLEKLTVWRFWMRGGGRGEEKRTHE